MAMLAADELGSRQRSCVGASLSRQCRRQATGRRALASRAAGTRPLVRLAAARAGKAGGVRFCLPRALHLRALHLFGLRVQMIVLSENRVSPTAATRGVSTGNVVRGSPR